MFFIHDYVHITIQKLLDRACQGLANVPCILSVDYIKRSTSCINFSQDAFLLKHQINLRKLEIGMGHYLVSRTLSSQPDAEFWVGWNLVSKRRLKTTNQGNLQPKTTSAFNRSENVYWKSTYHDINLYQSRLRNKFAAAVSTSLVIAGQSG